ncbi:MAG: hypothetical protein K0S47_3189 [Herbinix sp.]|jgi:hypothetical protein|nr:hypothetical protein [Herbinix sp.]
MKEIWKDVVGQEGNYKISNIGRIFSIKTNKIRKPCSDKNGYQCVDLSINGIKYKAKIHRLVATAFIENPLNLPLVNHIDEHKANNTVENLEWCNNQYNIRYSQSKKIRGINIKTGKAILFEAQIDCRAKGFDHRGITRNINGITKQYKGYVWEYTK